MAVRKREWTSPSGKKKSAWIVDYRDQAGERRHKTFEHKKEADAFETRAKGEVASGTHVADSASATVAKACGLWLESCRAEGLEASTVKSYGEHCNLHIIPFLGAKKLSRLTVADVTAFRDSLRLGLAAPGEVGGAKRSAAMTAKILVTLGTMLADAQGRGLVSHNVARERPRGKRGASAARHKRLLEIGVDIPSPGEIKAFLAALQEPWKAFLMLATFTGLRASELRGLRWTDIDLAKRTLTVRQRADFQAALGSPKSAAARRTLPLPEPLAAELLKAKFAARDRKNLVFATSSGRPWDHSNVVSRGLKLAWIAAGVVKPDGSAKYTGLHSLRHWYASWCINRRDDGGLELPPKIVQTRLGHSTLAMTMDTYGHLFPSADDGSEMAAAADALLR